VGVCRDDGRLRTHVMLTKTKNTKRLKDICIGMLGTYMIKTQRLRQARRSGMSGVRPDDAGAAVHRRPPHIKILASYIESELGA
jgi:hypothetical protein